MIVYFVLAGFATGTLAATGVVMSGGGVLLAIAAYSGAGAFGVVAAALIGAFVRPQVERRDPCLTLPVGDVRSVHARATTGARPPQTGRPGRRPPRPAARMQAQAPRR